MVSFIPPLAVVNYTTRRLVSPVSIAQRAQLANIGITITHEGIVFGDGYTADQIYHLLKDEGIRTDPIMMPPPQRQF